MKKFVFILSFVFAMFFANTTFASTTDNSSVNEKAEIVLAKTFQNVDNQNLLAIKDICADVYLVDIDGDGLADGVLVIYHYC